jgi:hypothetical protein
MTQFICKLLIIRQLIFLEMIVKPWQKLYFQLLRGCKSNGIAILGFAIDESITSNSIRGIGV